MIDRPDSAISATRDNMITLTLPDGAMRTVARGTLPSEVIRSIGERLLRDAIAVEVDGQIQDLVTPLRSGGSFRVLTRSDPRSLDVLRHSAALRSVLPALGTRNDRRGGSLNCVRPRISPSERESR